MGNEKYEIVVKSPLLRPGLEVSVKGVSERYLVPVMHGLVEYVRQFNMEEAEEIKSKEKGLEKKTE